MEIPCEKWYTAGIMDICVHNAGCYKFKSLEGYNMGRNKGGMRYLFSEDIQYVGSRKRKFNHKTLVAVIAAAVLLMGFSAVSFMMIHTIYKKN